MNNRDGQVLTPSVAQELIIELFAGATVQKQGIVRRVDEAHTERGGQPPTAGVDRPVTHALSKMKQSGLAESQGGGIWVIKLYQIKTLDDFIKWAKKFASGEYVFRGVPNESYRIQASAFRRPEERFRDFDKFRQINEDLIDRAILRGYNKKNGHPLTHLEILAELQHYGAATCLIDFSYSAQIALWFACQSKKESENPPNGKVFAVHHRSSDFEEIKSDLLEKKINEFLQDDGHTQLYHWQPQQQNNRIIAQQSIFLFGRYEFDPYDECVIERSSKEDILIELERVSGITETMLFPDFHGFARLRSENTPYMELRDYEYRELARELFHDEKYVEAVDYYDRAINLNPNYAEAYYWRGRAKLRHRQHALAILDFNEFVSMNPDYAEVYVYRAMAKFYLGYTDEITDEIDEDIKMAMQLAHESGDVGLMNSIMHFVSEIDSLTEEGAQDE